MKKKLVALALSAAMIVPFANNANAEVQKDLVRSAIVQDNAVNYTGGKYLLSAAITNNSDVPVKLKMVKLQVALKVGTKAKYITFSVNKDDSIYNQEIQPHSKINYTFESRPQARVNFEMYKLTSQTTDFNPTKLYLTKTGVLYKVIDFDTRTNKYRLYNGVGKPSLLVSPSLLSNVNPTK